MKASQENQVSTNLLCGFPLSVFRCPESPTPAIGRDKGIPEICKKSRLSIISNGGIAPDKEINTKERKKVVNLGVVKPTKPRKWVTYAKTLSYEGTDYKINTTDNSGVYTGILRKAIQQLDICMAKWSRVFVLRFDLHQKYHKQDNAHISRFRDNLIGRLRRSYKMPEIGYLWVREQEKAKKLHYHFAIFLDGNKIRHHSKIQEIATEAWENIAVGNHLSKVRNPFYFIDNEEIKADTVYRISYLAKERGKGYRKPQTKDYSTSRLRTSIERIYD